MSILVGTGEKIALVEMAWAIMPVMTKMTTLVVAVAVVGMAMAMAVAVDDGDEESKRYQLRV